MSWYVGLDGRKVWVDRDDTVITVGEAPEEQELSLENLAYLASATSKAVYAEHIIDDDPGDKRGKKAKEKQSGKQRGFVVRLDSDSRTRVTAPLQAAADRLIEAGVVTRIDLDDSGAPGKRKGKDKDKDKGPAVEEISPPLGANECRVETRARIQHFAHGHGFQVDVLESGSRQRLHLFTAEQELSAEAWHQRMLAAIEAAGSRVALGRMAGEDLPPGPAGRGASKGGVVQPAPPKRDEAREQEDDWLDSVFGRCMVPRPAKAGQGAGAAPDEGGEGLPAGDGGAEAAPAAAKPKPQPALPPWLRR